MLSKIYQWGLRPLLFALDPELAHKAAIATGQAVSNSHQLQALFSSILRYQNPRLQQRVMGIDFPNPLGLAAGFDKDAIGSGGWSSFGFGSAEMGSITFHAQPGNPQPRLFRLPQDEAILNRMGFNNLGAEAVAERFRTYRQQHQIMIPIGINLGKSKITPLNDAKNDYLQSFKLLQDLGDYFVINVSSPNTPGLRDLQAVDALQEIITAIQGQNRQNKPLLIKIAPDLNDDDIREIVQITLFHNISGLIATNTAIARDHLKTQILPATGNSIQTEPGGISGKPLQKRSTAVIKLINQASQGKITIIGVGGIASADDAWEKITAGASLLQIYTGWVYQGLPVIKEILQGLIQKLDAAGLDNIAQAVGSPNNNL
jgi:dihydroorotate dehydrogenase